VPRFARRSAALGAEKCRASRGQMPRFRVSNPDAFVRPKAGSSPRRRRGSSPRRRRGG
jgi:hypothetical protein